MSAARDVVADEVRALLGSRVDELASGLASLEAAFDSWRELRERLADLELLLQASASSGRG